MCARPWGSTTPDARTGGRTVGPHRCGHRLMHGADTPSGWIVRFAVLIADAAQVLDVACGSGRHSRFFAARGCRVAAVDRDPQAGAALAGVAGVQFTCADIEVGPWPFAGRQFDAVIVTNYLHRPLFPRLVESLADGGVLLVETFAAGNERYGKPSNPAFLLRAAELLQAFGGTLHVLAFEDGMIDNTRRARVQRLAAVRTDAAVHERLCLP